MTKISARNNDLLKSVKAQTSPKVYDLLLDLVNENREDLAELVLKVDYLLNYANTCIKQKDYDEAKETLAKAKVRIENLKGQGANTDYLVYLYEGLINKCK